MSLVKPGARGEGRFEPRLVKPGARGEGYVEIAEGVKEGEQVVIGANFLIDAESNLARTLGHAHARHGVPGMNSQTER